MAVVISSAPGLSPRVRGNHAPLGWKRPRRRSIPACAGEPGDADGGGSHFRVYPRVCGGTCQRRYHDPGFDGLSPRVRGNLLAAGADFGAAGSIPACAGEPAAAVPAALLSGVYPRVCGGTGDIPDQLRRLSGLSPRVRGNPRPASYAACMTRSIPACAGEPDSLCGTAWLRRVYPRVCGGTGL